MTDQDATKWIEKQIDDALSIQQEVRKMAPLLTDVALRMADVLQNGGKVIFFGNGGSAADAQHWAAELSGRFYMDRPSLPAIALSTNSSQLTAIGNDYGFDEVFVRPLTSLGHAGDMAVGISTSGNSKNVVRALQEARARGIVAVGFTGAAGGAMTEVCDHLIRIPSQDVARIQEGHELCAHVIFSVVENRLFGTGSGAFALRRR